MPGKPSPQAQENEQELELELTFQNSEKGNPAGSCLDWSYNSLVQTGWETSMSGLAAVVIETHSEA